MRYSEKDYLPDCVARLFYPRPLKTEQMFVHARVSVYYVWDITTISFRQFNGRKATSH